jgi:hypothetical protein
MLGEQVTKVLSRMLEEQVTKVLSRVLEEQVTKVLSRVLEEQVTKVLSRVLEEPKQPGEQLPKFSAKSRSEQVLESSARMQCRT